MKTGLSVLVLTGVLFSFAPTAFGANLVNEDDTAHVVLIDSEQELTIEAGSELPAFCGECTVQLVDSPDPAVSVGEDNTVVIDQGKLIVE
ncbi:hypothetical protein [Terasakiella pusilla]|uniref:hypothetical protein n=1 Tax=Terasakiella pusilla TaxID=64973 RepID=UPI00048FC177|nr:hypothetical protein [Terasakiella pusilla]